MTGREDRITLGYRFLCLTWKHTYVGSGTV
ncbi:hypothetical protein J2W80_006473 [Methylorubrum extorquens]|nr:hypothetical protein [Methylorubrum extorquens]MCP1591248.1 hypothetical protein [Methylorubrum extorquens]